MSPLDLGQVTGTDPRAFGEIAKRHTKMVSVCKERTLAAYDGHSHLMWDTAAVFCFKRSQPVLQFAIVVEKRFALHLALV